GRVALQPADGDRAMLGAEHASPDAEFVDRANASAGVAHEVRVEDRRRGTENVARGDLADEGRHVDIGWARLDARRIEAVEAAVRLDGRLVRRVGRIGLGEGVLKLLERKTLPHLERPAPGLGPAFD